VTVIAIIVNDGKPDRVIRHVPPEFAAVIRWLILERHYQIGKWDYGEQDLKHALGGLDDPGWFWEKGVLNYTGRVRYFGITQMLGMQAHLKLIATLVSMPEHLLRGGYFPDGLPRPGLSSGNLD
jgi:hypothetical protein